MISAPTKEEEQREMYQRRQSFNSLSPKHPKLTALADACAKERNEWGKSLKLHLILIQRYVFSEGGWRALLWVPGSREAGGVPARMHLLQELERARVVVGSPFGHRNP